MRLFLPGIVGYLDMMRQAVFSISALLFASAFLQLGGGLLGTVVALRMAVAEFPVFIAGAVVSGYFIGYVLGVFYSHRLIDGVGHIRAFAALASLLSAATLLHPFLVSPIPWGGLRFVQGFCLAGLAVCTESWLNERATNEIRGRILSLYMIVMYLALVCGQLLLSVPDPSGFGLFVISSVLLSLALVPVAATRVQAPVPQPPSRFSFRELWEISPLGVTGSFSSGLILGSFYGLMPFFAESTGLTTTGTSHLMAATIFGGLVFQWPIGRLSDRIDRRLILVVMTGLASVIAAVIFAALTLPVWDVNPRWLLLGMAPLLGAAVFSIYPLSVAHTNDFIDPSHLVSASAGLILAYGVGAIIGPPVASGLMELIGPIGLFVFFGAAGLTTAAFGAWRMSVRPAVPVEDRDPFHLVTRTTTMSSELDPRGETEETEEDTEEGGSAQPGEDAASEPESELEPVETETEPPENDERAPKDAN